MSNPMTKKQAREVIDVLLSLYPDAKAELDFTNPYELLIATILSAQCTDVRVNATTRKLFPKYPNPEALSKADPHELEEELYEVGLFKTKAKNIRMTAQILVDQYNSEVPSTMEELVQLPGVGRKTANVVLSNAFDVPSIAVDTHVFRVSNRIGLSKSADVVQCEKDLQKIIAQELWSKSHHLLIFHGRRCCKARKPMCGDCKLFAQCKWKDKKKYVE